MPESRERTRSQLISQGCLLTVKCSSINLTLFCFSPLLCLQLNSLCAVHSRNSQQGVERGEYRNRLGPLIAANEFNGSTLTFRQVKLMKSDYKSFWETCLSKCVKWPQAASSADILSSKTLLLRRPAGSMRWFQFVTFNTVLFTCFMLTNSAGVSFPKV